MLDPTSITILVVDDHDASRYAVSRLLRREGFQVWEAATGQDSLACIERRPDLVVLDVHLPDISGFEVCRRVKSNPATASVLVLHLSATAIDTADRVAGLEGGADGYLVQPVEPSELLATIRSLLRLREARERASRLHAVAAALSDVLSPRQVLEVIVARGASLLGIQAAALALLSDDGTLHLSGALGPTAEAAAVASAEHDQPNGMLDAHSPLGEAVSTGTPIYLESRTALEARFSEAARAGWLAGYEAAALLPLRLEARTVGAIGFGFGQARAFDREDREFLETLARLCAQAMERALLHAVQQQTAARLEERVQARTAELRRANAELEQSQAKLRALSAHLEAVREEERTRIAREIHDVLGQQLTGMRMDVAMLGKLQANQATLQARTAALMQSIDETIQTVRRIATELRPPVLDDFGLAAAIEWQLGEFQRRFGIECVWLPPAEEVTMPPDVTAAVFRVFQESLTNVARHAGASRVEVSLGTRGGYVQVKVRDNGRGITTADLNNAKSLGVLGMQERVGQFGGELHIQGGPGQGTTVIIRVPVGSVTGESHHEGTKGLKGSFG